VSAGYVCFTKPKPTAKGIASAWERSSQGSESSKGRFLSRPPSRCCLYQDRMGRSLSI
jgi:hypothetical protein